MLTALLALALPALAGPGGDLPNAAEKNPKDGSLRIWGQVQTWATLVDQDDDPVADPYTYGDPEHDPGFSIPRARLGAGGMLPRTTKLVQARWGVGFGVGSPYDYLSLNDTDVQVIDATGQVLLANDFGPTWVTAGIQRIPFSRGLLESSRDLVFQERAVASQHMGHGRDAGVILGQRIDVSDDATVGLRVAAFNGNEDFRNDTDPGLLAVARAEFALGRAYQSFDQNLAPAFGIAFNILNNDQRATNTTRMGADLLARYKWFTVSGEYLLGTIAPGDSNAVAPAVSQKIDQSGLNGQLSVFIPTTQDGPGGIEIASRLSMFDDDAASQDLGDVRVIHSGVTWRGPTKHVDVGAGYILRLEGGNTQLKNDTVRMWVQFRPTYEVL